MRILSILWFLVIILFLTCVGVAQAGSGPVMVEKNLFAQDRKPTPPESATPTPQANRPGLNPKAVQLDGVFMHGDVKKAIVRLKGQIPGAEKAKSSPFMTVREGEKIGDYQVTKIEPKSISLEKDGQSIIVNLFMEGKVAPPVPPVPSAPAVQVPPGSQGGVPQDVAGARGEGIPRPPRGPNPRMPGGGAVPPGMGAPNVAAPGGGPQGGSGFEAGTQEEELTDEEIAAEEAAGAQEAGQ